jgi:chitinase
VVGLLAVVLATIAVITNPFRSATASSETAHLTWFAPYVDVTLTPSFPFGDTRYNPADAVVLGFVVAAADDPCAASWGGYYTPAEAAQGIDLDRRLATLRRRGGDAIVSFGGAVNDDLATGCTDDAALADAYASVIERYDTTVADFDIEGDSLADAAARGRRATAVAAVQQRVDGLQVWLTLPVATSGLTDDGVATVAAFLAAGVDLAGVNAMTMDFGTLTDGDLMSDAAAAALVATANQVGDAFAAAGQRLSDADLWTHLGATVMVGRNDVRTEIFTIDDAARLVEFAHDRGLGRLSMWSLSRDTECGPEVDGGVAQNTCSGVEQEVGAFAAAFAAEAGSSAPAGPATTVAIDPKASRAAPVTDDPATAPYPIWAPGGSYAADAKVVWHGNVYQAKWWNQDVQPDTPVANPWETPWSLVGPVLSTDTPAPTTTSIPEGWYPDWNRATEYQAGSEIQHGGVAYQAKWFSSGQEPGAATANPWDTPWTVITDPSPTPTTTPIASTTSTTTPTPTTTPGTNS